MYSVIVSNKFSRMLLHILMIFTIIRVIERSFGSIIGLFRSVLFHLGFLILARFRRMRRKIELLLEPCLFLLIERFLYDLR